jgi:hypothetical protein
MNMQLVPPQTALNGQICRVSGLCSPTESYGRLFKSKCKIFFSQLPDKLIVGKESNMKETVDPMVSFKRILTPET